MVQHWTGLRPHRLSGVRLETGKLPTGKTVSAEILCFKFSAYFQTKTEGGGQEGIFHNERMALSHYIYNLQIVHNYGHGGSGVTLHWGCAGQVVQEIRAVTTSAVSRL